MRMFSSAVAALTVFLTFPATAEIIEVAKVANANGPTIIRGSEPSCGIGAKIIRNGVELKKEKCLLRQVHNQQQATQVTIVVLAHRHHRHYIRHD